ncbi:MAG: helix-turn-helix transcriptional regulator [Clostridia bacterium]|nr:helix-turn-helix transcriptional regulator [Clostridia bacterium]
MNYRTRLRNMREDHDLTQEKIGAILNKTQQGYEHIEAGRAELKIEDLVKLCQFYNISADYMIGLTDEMRSFK